MANFRNIVTSVLAGALISHIDHRHGVALASHQQQPCSRAGGVLLGSPPALPVEKHETCTHWYRLPPGDSCLSVLQRGGLSPALLAELNGKVDNMCKGELKPGAWLCLASGPELPTATAKAKSWFGLGPAILQTGSSSSTVATTSPALPSVSSTAGSTSHTALDTDTAVVSGDEPVDIKKRNDDAPAARTLESHHRQALAPPRMRNTWFAAPHQQSTTVVATATDHPGGSMSTEAETTTTVTHTLSGGDADDSPTGSVGTATFTGPGDGKTAWPGSSSSSSSSDLPDGSGGDGKTAFPVNSTTTSTVTSMVATTTSFIPVVVTTTATLSSSSTTPTLWRRHARSRRPQQPSGPDEDSRPDSDGDTQLLSPEQAAHCSRREPTVDRCLAAINGAETSMLRFCAWYTDPARPAQSQTAIVQFAAPAVRHQAVEEQAGKNGSSGTLIPPPLLPRPAALEQACARATGAPAVLLPPLYIAATAAATAAATTRPPHLYLSSACSCLGHFDRSHRLAVAATGVPGVDAAAEVDGFDSDEPDSDLDLEARKKHSNSRRYLQPWWVQPMLQAYAKTATDGYYASSTAVAPRAEPTHTHVLPAAAGGDGDGNARVMVVVTKVVSATGEKRATTRTF